MNFAYKPGRHFFDNVNLELESGRIHFIQGKNGVGKSTFFHILQGTTPDKIHLNGTFTINNQTFEIKNNQVSSSFCDQVKTVVQEVNSMLASNLTAEENLCMAALNSYPGLQPLTHKGTLPAIMSEFNIDPTLSVARLSGGQKQILSIMMATQKKAQILLLDEPTAALDEKNTHMVIEFLQQLAKKLDLIILFITHEKELVSKYGQNDYIEIVFSDTQERKIIRKNPTFY